MMLWWTLPVDSRTVDSCQPLISTVVNLTRQGWSFHSHSHEIALSCFSANANFSLERTTINWRSREKGHSLDCPSPKWPQISHQKCCFHTVAVHHLSLYAEQLNMSPRGCVLQPCHRGMLSRPASLEASGSCVVAPIANQKSTSKLKFRGKIMLLVLLHHWIIGR